jgi:hypothetical protein
LDPEVKLPPGVWPTHKDKVVEQSLINRGITPYKQVEAHIWCNENFIFIPVFSGQKLVNIVQRRISRGSENIFNVPHKQRYLYIEGVSTTNFLYSWNDRQSFTTVTFVENTFNAIAMHRGFDMLNVSTNFGSYLSDRQVELIKKSQVKQVLFLWDEGAPATKAIEKLRKIGVRAESFSLAKGQPDDYNLSDWKRIIYEAHEAISDGTYSEFIRSQPLSMRYKNDL